MSSCTLLPQRPCGNGMTSSSELLSVLQTDRSTATETALLCSSSSAVYFVSASNNRRVCPDEVYAFNIASEPTSQPWRRQSYLPPSRGLWLTSSRLTKINLLYGMCVESRAGNAIAERISLKRLPTTRDLGSAEQLNSMGYSCAYV
jgi:hypothetical protein